MGYRITDACCNYLQHLVDDDTLEQDDVNRIAGETARELEELGLSKELEAFLEEAKELEITITKRSA